MVRIIGGGLVSVAVLVRTDFVGHSNDYSHLVILHALIDYLGKE